MKLSKFGENKNKFRTHIVMLCQFLIGAFGADWQAERYRNNNLVKRVQEKIKIWRKFIFPFLTNFGPKMKNFLIVTFCPFTLWPNFFPVDQILIFFLCKSVLELENTHLFFSHVEVWTFVRLWNNFLWNHVKQTLANIRP